LNSISNEKLSSIGKSFKTYFQGNTSYYDISNNTYNDFYNGIKSYDTTKTENFNYVEKLIDIFFALNWSLISIYWAITVVTFYAFFTRKSKLILFFSFLVLFTLPCIMILNGFYATTFFAFGDFCEGIYHAIYLNYFPVDKVALGNFVSCYDGVIINDHRKQEQQLIL